MGTFRHAAASNSSERMVNDDAQLIDEALAGQSVAFGRLVTKYQDRLYNALIHVIGSAEEAQDVVQDAFVQAFLKLESFHRSAAFYTWLYRIAFNLAISRFRKMRPTISVDRARELSGRGNRRPRSAADRAFGTARTGGPGASGAGGARRKPSGGVGAAGNRRLPLRIDRRNPRSADRHRAEPTASGSHGIAGVVKGRRARRALIMDPLFQDERISAYLDGQLPPDERSQFEDEMARNGELRQVVEELRGLAREPAGVAAAAFGRRLCPARAASGRAGDAYGFARRCIAGGGEWREWGGRCNYRKRFGCRRAACGSGRDFGNWQEPSTVDLGGDCDRRGRHADGAQSTAEQTRQSCAVGFRATIADAAAARSHWPAIRGRASRTNRSTSVSFQLRPAALLPTEKLPSDRWN